jgi:hypothetical protein
MEGPIMGTDTKHTGPGKMQDTKRKQPAETPVSDPSRRQDGDPAPSKETRAEKPQQA